MVLQGENALLTSRAASLSTVEQEKQVLEQKVSTLERAASESQKNANILSNLDTTGDPVLTQLKEDKQTADGQVGGFLLVDSDKITSFPCILFAFVGCWCMYLYKIVQIWARCAVISGWLLFTYLAEVEYLQGGCGGGGGRGAPHHLTPDVWAQIGGRWVLFGPGGR